MNFDARIDPGSASAEQPDGNPLYEGEEDRRSRRWLILAGIVVLLVMIAIWFVTRDSGMAGRMTGIIARTASESRRRFAPARPAKQFTFCVAKENGRWVAA